MSGSTVVQSVVEPLSSNSFSPVIATTSTILPDVSTSADPSSPESRADSLTPSSTTSASTAATSIADSTELKKVKKEKEPKVKDDEASPSKSKDSSSASSHDKKKKSKPHTINHATGISTTVPLTGDRVRPAAHPSLDDKVLMAIFEILHDDDAEVKGMTVKHICDILIKKHPEMANLSSKTSNLVSAKLNAYVKRIEKGDKSMKYALSRVWADTSPRRMVYVYRGVLSEEYPQFVSRAIAKLRSEEAIRAAKEPSHSLEDDDEPTAAHDSSSSASPFSTGDRNPPLAQRVGLAGYPQVVSPAGVEFKHQSPFKDASLGMPQFSVPYSSAPVTASLNTTTVTKASPESEVPASAWLSLNDSESEEEDICDMLRPSYSDETDMANLYARRGYYRHGSVLVRERVPSSLGKRSKSMSFIQSKRPKTPHVTAAAATPRIPRKQSIAGSPSAAAAVAALRASALNNSTSPLSESVSSITSSIMSDTSVEPSISMKWLETVRSGFLNQDIESPEDVSLAELDGMFA
ncbi:DEKNAAC103483 [Brettanomyces naardenensis]|uniref:DEKNAAC103483 n=1 Tax=Brettanomyces naardenensis TaxID=13370 RepID=A0A448YNC7_BRENA|nr:DEKNAAC103483 [Brettanomyces naardenensis]